MDQLLAQAQALIWPAITLAATVAIALLAHYLFYLALGRFAGRTAASVDNSLVQHSRRPARLIIPLLAVFLVFPTLRIPQPYSGWVRHALGLFLIASVGWLMIALINVIEDVLNSRYRIDTRDNLAARRVATQAQFLRRLAIIIIGVITLAAMLMTFPTIWNLGAGLFASAGVAGLVIAMAARPTLSSLLAGLQIALTEPIRIDDVVIVEGEWGWIEEIGSTYVVVRIWDLRRLVIPLNYFIEKPFQNWTRTSADLLGTVFVYTDYTVPVDEIRQELKHILEASGMWDGKVCGLQVTNADRQTMELRALMSAPDSGTAWDLRCHVREKLIAFLQQRYPESLPRIRAQLQRSGDAEPGKSSETPPARLL